MIFNLFIELLILFEIWKLTKFKFNFKLKYISIDYNKNILKRTKSVAYREILKLSLFEIVYAITTIIGLFTINNFFFLCMIIISFIQNIIFKYIKNKTTRKITFFIKILSSIIFLALTLLNNYIFKTNSFDLIKNFLNR